MQGTYLVLFCKIKMNQVKKSVGKFAGGKAQKGVASPLGVACATFLCGWPGVFRQLRCVESDTFIKFILG